MRAFKALARARRLDESITEATPDKQKNKGLEPIPVKHEASDTHSYTQKFRESTLRGIDKKDKYGCRFSYQSTEKGRPHQTHEL